jgi:hypothetical protein
MAQPAQALHLPRPRRRRALLLLASCNAEGYSVVDLVPAGLATAMAERLAMGPRKIEVARVRVTEAGRGALVKVKQ